MPLPQQVINQLNQETPDTPGWSFGIMLFSGGVVLLTIVIYFIITLAYEPYLNTQASSVQNQVSQLANSISTSDENDLFTFSSEVTNLQSLLSNHIFVSQFLTWLEHNTESHIYYSKLNLTSSDQVTLVGNAVSEADINEQVAIFEASPQVRSVTVSSVGISGVTGLWQFNASLLMAPAVFASTIAPSVSVPTQSQTP